MSEFGVPGLDYLDMSPFKEPEKPQTKPPEGYEWVQAIDYSGYPEWVLAPIKTEHE